MKRILVLVLFMTSFIYAGMGSGMGNRSGMGSYALKHANPMPNLMRVALGNSALLGLSKSQIDSLNTWRTENQGKLRSLAQQVLSEERALHEHSLTNDDMAMKKATNILELRKQIMQTKTNCRTTLRKVLSKEQYNKVVSIYKSMN